MLSRLLLFLGIGLPVWFEHRAPSSGEVEVNIRRSAMKPPGHTPTEPPSWKEIVAGLATVKRAGPAVGPARTVGLAGAAARFFP